MTQEQLRIMESIGFQLFLTRILKKVSCIYRDDFSNITYKSLRIWINPVVPKHSNDCVTVEISSLDNKRAKSATCYFTNKVNKVTKDSFGKDFNSHYLIPTKFKKLYSPLS